MAEDRKRTSREMRSCGRPLVRTSTKETFQSRRRHDQSCGEGRRLGGGTGVIWVDAGESHASVEMETLVEVPKQGP